ncbi:nucleoporin 88-like [Gigantopelta aegis]|uniref:nucleoporin 88-like n=1 Tax=Gigantopelta aegis TaxID=1735272 RepID=UPI001B8890E4|nr:nucleoporin 88-like [Gigantopelta aegis]
MAASNSWCNGLNSHQFCKLLKENNVKDSRKKLTSDAKELILTHDCDLYVWDSYACHLIYFNIKNLLPEAKPKDKANRYQTLLCTHAPMFDVEALTLSPSGSHIAVWGQLGIKVLELPRRCGKYAEFEGGKEIIACRTISIAQRYFAIRQGLKLHRVMWHPGSRSADHLALLTSDNIFSIYDISEPDKPVQMIHLDDGEFDFNVSPSKMTLSTALGETAVSFDFGPPVELKVKERLGIVTNDDDIQVWPAYIVKGSGDVVIAYTALNQERQIKLPVQGPLVMHPPADDNYGVDACAILCLNSTPPVLVVTTREGKLHHCLVLAGCDEADISFQSDSSWQRSFDSSIFQKIEEPALFVLESVELELSLTTTRVENDEVIGNDFTCPVRLVKDPVNCERYHCCHGAGVHSVVLPWIQSIHKFISDVDGGCAGLPENEECVVEHLVCTKPLSASPPAPILGMDIVNDPTELSLKQTLLALTSDMEFVALPLRIKHHSPSAVLFSDSPGSSVESPLRQLYREPFHNHIERILQRNSSNPLLKSGKKSELSQQECFQLLSRATQVFREEYIQKQSLAHLEIETRVRILQEQKKLQLSDIQSLQESRNILRDKAQGIAEKIETARDEQEKILKRLESVTRKIQSRIPMLSDAEKTMQRELKLIKANLETYQRSLEQVSIKQKYQERQLSQKTLESSKNIGVDQKQVVQLRVIIKHEGDEISDLMKKVNQLKMDTTL